MKNPYEQHLTEDRRLVVLRLLKDVGGKVNDRNILVGLHQLGHERRVTLSTVRSDLAHLETWGAVAVDKVPVPDDVVWVAKLTQFGRDVANGDAEVDGVRRPSGV